MTILKVVGEMLPGGALPAYEKGDFPVYYLDGDNVCLSESRLTRRICLPENEISGPNGDVIKEKIGHAITGLVLCAGFAGTLTFAIRSDAIMAARTDAGVIHMLNFGMMYTINTWDEEDSNDDIIWSAPNHLKPKNFDDIVSESDNLLNGRAIFVVHMTLTVHDLTS